MNEYRPVNTAARVGAVCLPTAGSHGGVDADGTHSAEQKTEFTPPIYSGLTI